MTDEPSDIGERLGKALELRGLSQQGLEREAGLSKGYVSRIRRGNRIRLSPPTMRAIADALRVSYEWLATGRGDIDATDQGEADGAAGRKGKATKHDALDVAVAYHDGKWSRAAIAAAEALSKEEGAPVRSPQDWALALDQIERTLSGLRPTRAQ